MRLRILALALVAAACVETGAELTPTTVGETVATTTTEQAEPIPPPSTTTSVPQTATTLPPTTTTTTLVAPDGLTAADRLLTEIEVISGGLAAKSVVHSGYGLFFAQNMMYRHTVSVFDRNFELLATISDRVEPSEFGFGEDFPGTYQGSPVEATFTSDGSHAYVSNYRMYGGGLSTAASDGCNRGNWPDSFVYRVDTRTLEIDQLLRVGSVPKFLAVTPDDKYLLVSNWCGFDVSILDVGTGSEVARIDVGRHPRGIAVTHDSSLAYVGVMGSRDIAMIDLETWEVDYLRDVGSGPRHLLLSPDARFLYVSLNSADQIVKINVASKRVIGRVSTGDAPRSMVLSDDGTALYVVNYFSDTLSKVRTSDMTEIAEIRVSDKPIGITYDAATRQVWVSAYSGTIEVFQDSAP